MAHTATFDSFEEMIDFVSRLWNDSPSLISAQMIRQAGGTWYLTYRF